MPDTQIIPQEIITTIKRKELNGNAEIWMLDTDQISGLDETTLLPLLDQGTLLRYSRIVHRQRRSQFLLGRILLKYALSELLGINCHRIAFQENSNAAPVYLIDGTVSENIRFSLSHSKNFIACATSLTAPIGLDIEKMENSRNIDAISQFVFLEEEKRWLEHQPEESRRNHFYLLWTKKEACYKWQSSQNAVKDARMFGLNGLNDSFGKWESWIDGPLVISVFQSP